MHVFLKVTSAVQFNLLMLVSLSIVFKSEDKSDRFLYGKTCSYKWLNVPKLVNKSAFVYSSVSCGMFFDFETMHSEFDQHLNQSRLPDAKVWRPRPTFIV